MRVTWSMSSSLFSSSWIRYSNASATRHFALFFLLPEHAGEHVFDVDVHLLDALIGDDFERRHGAFADFEIHHALVQFAFTKLTRNFSRVRSVCSRCRGAIGFRDCSRGSRRRRKQKIENPLFGGVFGAIGHFIELFFADHVDGGFHQVANHGLHVAPDVTDFRVFRSFHFDERAAREARQSPRDFRFAHASRADHQNIFGQDVFGDFWRKFLAAHAIAQRHRYGTLGRVLSDDVFIQLDDDFPRRHVVQRGKQLRTLGRRCSVGARNVYNFFV